MCFTRVCSGLTCKHQTRLERVARDERSSLFQKVVTYVRKKFCNTATWRNPFQRQRFYEIWTFCHQSYKTFFCCKLHNNFILFLTYIQAQYAKVLDYTSPERLCRDKHSTLVGPFVSCEENEVLSRKYQRGKYQCTIDLVFDWFGISCMTTDNFCFFICKTD